MFKNLIPDWLAIKQIYEEWHIPKKSDPNTLLNNHLINLECDFTQTDMIVRQTIKKEELANLSKLIINWLV